MNKSALIHRLAVPAATYSLLAECSQHRDPQAHPGDKALNGLTKSDLSTPRGGLLATTTKQNIGLEG
jgi:hypothetical protein